MGAHDLPCDSVNARALKIQITTYLLLLRVDAYVREVDSARVGESLLHPQSNR
jgi:hypothetical protein